MRATLAYPLERPVEPSSVMILTRMVRSIATSLFLALVAVTLPAADTPRPTLALVGGQVIDGYEGTPIPDGTVLIAGDRIVAVGPRPEVPVPAGTTVIDTAGMS